MPTSDKDLQKLQDETQALRDKLATARFELERSSRETNNDIAAAQLTAEKTRLQAELDSLPTGKKAVSDAVARGTAGPLSSARAEMELAVAQAKEAEKLRKADEKAAKGDTTPDDGDEATAVVAKSAATVDAPDAERRN